MKRTIEELRDALKPGGLVITYQAFPGWSCQLHKTQFVKLVDQLCRQEPGKLVEFVIVNPENTGHHAHPRRRVVLR